MTDNTTTTPAGWYPQPDGQQRYWDGQQWTQHVAPLSGSTPMAGGPGPAGHVVGGVDPVVKEQTARKWYTKKRVVIPVGALAFFVIVGIAIGGNKSATPVASGADASTTTAAPVQGTPRPVATPTPSAIAPSPPKASVAPAKPVEAPVAKSQLGQAVRDGKFEFTVSGIKCGIARVGDQYLGKDAQGQFCAVTMTVKNIGDEAQSMFADNQAAFSPTGQKYSASSEASIYADDSKLLFEEINPGNSLKGAVYFDVPKDVTLGKLELHDSFLSDGVTINVA